MAKSNKIFVLAAYDTTEQKVKKRNDAISDITGTKNEEIKPVNFVRYANTWSRAPYIICDKDPLVAKKYKTLKGIEKFHKKILALPLKKDKYGDPFIYEVSASDWNKSVDNLIKNKQEEFNRWKNRQEYKKLPCI